MPAPSAPAFQALGTAVTATTGSATVTWPAHAVDDVAFLMVEATANDPTLSTANGFVQVGTVIASTGSKLAVFWCRATSAAMASPVVAANTNHSYSRIITFRGCATSGNPYSVFASNTTNAIATSGSFKWPSTATQQTNMLVVNIAASSADSAAAWMGATPTNSQLTGLTVQLNAGTTTGDGGGLAVVTGVKAAAATSYGTTTATVVAATDVAAIAIVLMPVSAWLDAQPATGTFTGVQGVLTSTTPSTNATVTTSPYAPTLAIGASTITATQNISGTSATTLQAATSSANGKSTIAGSSATTLANATSTTSGTVGIAGSSATTLAAAT